MTTPYIGFASDTLDNQPKARAGDTFTCQACGEQHSLEAATDAEGKPSEVALFYRCRGVPYLGAIGGRLVAWVKPDVSGEADL